MPGRLKVYGGVVLPLAADDLAIPALFGILFRIIAMAVGVALLVVTLSQNDCALRSLDKGYMWAILVICIVPTLMYFAIYTVASTGNMLEFEKRTRKTEMLFNILAVVYVCELILGLFGIYVVQGLPCPAGSQMFIIEVTTIVAVFFDLVVLAAVLGLLIYLSQGKKPDGLDEIAFRDVIKRTLALIGCLCCGLFGGIQSESNTELAWSEISRVVHSFLKDIMAGYTVSDFFAAFVLLRAEQRYHDAQSGKAISSTDVASPSASNSGVKSPISIPTTPITGNDRSAAEAMQLFDEFAPYVIGIYGWKLQFYMNPLKFFLHFPVTVARRLIHGNQVEHHVFKATIGTNSKKRQIVYSSFTSYMGEAIPYTITADHEKKAIVITLRGTLSIGDLATDLLCTPASLSQAEKQWGVKDGHLHHAHRGMLQVANRIRADIEKQQILHRLMKAREETADERVARESFRIDETTLTNDDRESFLRAMGKTKRAPLPDGLMYSTEVFVNDRQLSNMNCSDYRLICCGHSLGSCTAAILSLLLKPRFPTVKCLAYSCVSAIFSRDLAEQSSNFIYSCTLGKDMFGRLSWHSAKKLRDQLLDIIRRSKASKSQIILSLIRSRVVLDELLYPHDAVPDEPKRRAIQELLDKLKIGDGNDLDKTSMYMPGRILYLEKRRVEGRRGWLCNFGRREYIPQWIEDRAAIQNIQISSGMILDHMPDTLVRVLHDTRNKHFGDPSPSWDPKSSFVSVSSVEALPSMFSPLARYPDLDV